MQPHDNHEIAWRERYGPHAPDAPDPISPFLETLLGHRSVRQFLPQPLPTGTLERIIGAAQSAASSSNLQAWSVIALEDEAHKARAAMLCGDQGFIRRAPLFLVFCADLARLSRVSENENLPGAALDYLEMFLVAVIDAALAAQNAAAAAEAEGLGICYVGAARNKPRELAELLHFPPRVFALFGMTIGVPDPQKPASIKPRLPQPEVLHREVYTTDAQDEHVAAYNATMREFYAEQKMDVPGDWTLHSARRVTGVENLSGREILADFLRERGFGLR